MEEKNYEWLKSTINSYNNSIDSDEKNFEHKITYLSAGGIVLLMTFIANIKGQFCLLFYILLGIGMAGLIVALISNMISYVSGARLKNAEVKYINEIIKANDVVEDNKLYTDIAGRMDTLSNKVNKWNITSLISMTVGILFAAFSVLITLN